jgi:SAM-dependent methyltransferase
VRSASAATSRAELEAFGEADFDVVIGALPRAQDELAQIARVLRGGGRWVSSWNPCWWGPQAPCAGVPDYAHLLLDERELRWYLELVAGAARAQECLQPLLQARSSGAELLARLAEAGFDCGSLKPVAPRELSRLPGKALLRELGRAHPGQGGFAALALEGLLLRRGSTIRIGNRAASAAGA